MKRQLAVIFVLIITVSVSLSQRSSKALLIIDIQDFYFPGGKMALSEPEKAAHNAALLLTRFREKNLPVIHVRHNSEPGGKINELVKPLENEKIITKNEINSFRGTDLNEYLKKLSVDTLVICGMQTHMCVEAAVRAGADLGYKIILVHDACTTRDLTYEGKTVKAQDVHLSTLVTLKNYAVLKSTGEYLPEI
jgi:nicotinamidase-related amidase